MSQNESTTFLVTDAKNLTLIDATRENSPWCKLTLNVKNTKFMMLTGKNLYIGTNKLKIGNQIIEQIGSNCEDKYFEFVGHVLDDKQDPQLRKIRESLFIQKFNTRYKGLNKKS